MPVLIRLSELQELASTTAGYAHWGLLPLALYISLCGARCADG